MPAGGALDRLADLRAAGWMDYNTYHTQLWFLLLNLERDPLYTVVRTHGMRFWMETPAPGDAFLKFTNLNVD